MDELIQDILRTVVNEYGDYDEETGETVLKLPQIIFTDEVVKAEHNTQTDEITLTLTRI